MSLFLKFQSKDNKCPRDCWVIVGEIFRALVRRLLKWICKGSFILGDRGRLKYVGMLSCVYVIGGR